MCPSRSLSNWFQFLNPEYHEVLVSSFTFMVLRYRVGMTVCKMNTRLQTVNILNSSSGFDREENHPGVLQHKNVTIKFES